MFVSREPAPLSHLANLSRIDAMTPKSKVVEPVVGLMEKPFVSRRSERSLGSQQRPAMNIHGSLPSLELVVCIDGLEVRGKFLILPIQEQEVQIPKPIQATNFALICEAVPPPRECFWEVLRRIS